MIHALRCEPYLKWVRLQPCCVRDKNCQGNVQAHHTGRAYFGTKGNARASDDTAVPVCVWHHRLVQDYQWIFRKRYGFIPDEEYARVKYYARFVRERQ